MEINRDKHLLGMYEGMKRTGFTHTVIGKICFEGCGDFKTIKRIAEYLEDNYKMYQYKKDNGIKFNEEELFYWTNNRESTYFDVTIQENYGIDRMKQIAEEIIQYIEENYQDSPMYVRLQYKEENDWNKINAYLEQDVNINNLELEKINQLFSLLNVSGNKLTRENKEKLININNTFISQYENKKVLWNGDIKGTIKKLRNGDFGLFKPRATRTYYPINLGKIKSLEAI